MYFCYLDESGTHQTGAQTSHFVLLGLAIPARAWHPKDKRINAIKARYGLQDVEIHAGYIARRFPEQEHISGFEKLKAADRRITVSAARSQALVKAAALKTPAQLNHLKKLYRKTDGYVHLSLPQRTELLRELADEIASWSDARLFAEAVDKPKIAAGADIFGQAFEAVVSRFHYFLIHREKVRVEDGLKLSKYSADSRHRWNHIDCC